MRGYKNVIGYGITKAAIIQMTKAVANENGYVNGSNFVIDGGKTLG